MPEASNARNPVASSERLQSALRAATLLAASFLLILSAFRLLVLLGQEHLSGGPRLVLSFTLIGFMRDLNVALILALPAWALAALPPSAMPSPSAAGRMPGTLYGLGVGTALALLMTADAVFLRYNTRRLGFELFTLRMNEMGPALAIGLSEALPLLLAGLTLAWGSSYALYRFLPSRAPASVDSTFSRLAPAIAWFTVLLLSAGGHWLSVESRTKNLLYGELEQSLPAALVRNRLAMSKLPHFMPEHEALELVRALLTGPSPGTSQTKGDPFLRSQTGVRLDPSVRNVVLLLMEGVAAADITPTYAPHLARAASRGTSFENFYANGLRTRNGLVAVLTGWPDVVDFSAVKTYATFHRYASLPRLFQQRGFQVEFIYGGDASFETYDRFMRRRGLERITDRQALAARFPKRERTAFGDSYHDNVSLQVLGDRLKEPGGSRKLLLWLGLTTHPPFALPGATGLRGLALTRRERYLSTLRFTDRAIGALLARAAREGWARRTLFVITSDHTHHIGQSQLDNFHIPLILLGPGMRPRRVRTIGSQVDLLPTFQALLASQKPLPTAGRALPLDGRERPESFAFLNAGRAAALRNACGSTIIRPGSKRAFTALRPVNGLHRGACSRESLVQAQNGLRAYFQLTRNRLLRNRIR